MPIDREKYLARQARYNNSEKGRARNRARYQRLVGAGLCSRCRAQANPQITLCDACADKQAEAQRERYDSDPNYRIGMSLKKRWRRGLAAIERRNAEFEAEFGRLPSGMPDVAAIVGDVLRSVG
jgi:hypothetical protein